MPNDEDLSDDRLTGFASHDQLTGLLTRASLGNDLAAVSAPAELQQLSIMAVEITRFGAINDSVGAATGDRIISTSARRLTRTFPYARAIARLHGDHFGVVLEGDVDLAEETAKLVDFVQRPMILDGQTIVLAIRVGVAAGRLLPDIDDGMDLLHAAEVALHGSTPSSVTWFDATMLDRARTAHRMENDLRVALVRNNRELQESLANAEFSLEYQPVVSLRTGEIHAFEALLRWDHPEQGRISPASFIPMAERAGLMPVLGDWVLRRACKEAAGWPVAKSGRQPTVSINISPSQCTDGDILLGSVSSAIRESDIAPSRVSLEITETYQTTLNFAPLLERLRHIGCRLAIDDFGSGYATIAQLFDLHVDYLKVDRSIVLQLCDTDPDTCRRATSLTRAVLSIADAFELRAIVEGIETRDELIAARTLGADLVQGFVYARPMPSDRVASFIQNHDEGAAHA